MQIIETYPTPKITPFVLTMLLALGVVYFLFIPQYRDMNSKRDQIQTQTSTLNQIQTENEQAKRSMAQLSSMQDQFKLLDVAIPSQPDVADIYAQIEQMVKAANLVFVNVQAINELDPKDIDITQVDPNTPNPPKPLSPSLAEMQISFTVKGTQGGVQQMLASMERSLRFMDIQSIDVVRDESGGDTSYTINIKTYYQKKVK